MKAVQVTGPGELRYTDVPEPLAGSSVLVGIKTVGICGTDLKILTGGIPVAYPRIMGHEMVGEVLDGAGSGLAAGSRVMVDPAISCGSCALCRKGRTNLCLNGGLLGRDADGTFAEFVAAPVDRILPIPDHVSSTAAGLLQVAGTCVHAYRAAPLSVGDVTVVIGLGVSGLIFTQLLRAAGAVVIGVTRSAWKRDLAERLGASVTASPTDAAALIADVTEGAGADLTVEAVGTAGTLGQAIEWVRIGGEVLVFGTVTTGNQALPYYQMYFKELTLRNPRAAIGDDYARAIELASTRVLDLEPIVTDQLHLSDASQAFERVQGSDSLKVLMAVG